MAELYQDKSEEKIKSDISEQFKKDGGITRDDYEIYASAREVIASYIKEITASKESYGPRALQEFKKLDQDLSKEMDKMKGRKYLTENKKIINDIANRIDDAEKEVISRLALNRTNKSSIEAQKANPQYFMVGKDNSLLLTPGVNKPKIDEVLGTVFKNKNESYKIDYSGCTNQNIKNKMMSLTGTGTCYISYDVKQKTYLLRDSKGVNISQRALIREGVKLTPMGVVKFTAEQEQEKLKQQKTQVLSEASTITGTLDEIKKEPKRANIIKKIPAPLLSKLTAASATDADIFKRFLERNEKRMDEIIKDAKAKNYILQTEPVSKLNFGSGLMEVHLISGTAKKDVVVWDESHLIGSPILYDILDGEESAYKEFLTSRLGEKRNDYDHLTKNEDILATETVENSKEANIESEKKENMIYALGIFKQMLNAMKLKEGNSRDDDDKEFVAMIKHIDNSIYSLQNNENISQQSLEKNIFEPLRKKRFEFQSDNAGADADVVTRKRFELAFDGIFSGNKEKVIDGIRILGQGTTTFGNTHTSFLKDEIVGHLQISNAVINAHFQNIEKNLEIGDNETQEQRDKRIQLMDQLYEAEDGGDISTILIANNMLPKSWAGNKDIEKKCADIKTKLSEKKALSEKLPYSLASLAEDQRKEKLVLEAKPQKTEADFIKLQALQYLIENPEDQNTVNQEALSSIIDSIKYTGVGKIVKAGLASTFVELGGGAKGKNADVYNDIVGYGNFNVSDENAEIIGEITKEVLITIAVCIVTAGAGGVLLQAGLKGVSVVAKIVKAGNTAEKILKFAKLGKTTFKGLEAWRKFSTAEKAAKVIYRGTALLLEAPVFNSASKALKSTIAGNEIDMGWSDINPIAKQNIQTAAFLGALHSVGTIKGLLKIDFGKAAKTFVESGARAKASGTYTADLGTEFIAMMAAEQSINLLFGREEIDPVTGETHIVRGLHMPSQQELAQIIGMILGMRASARFNLMPRVESMLANSKLGIKLGSFLKGDMKVVDTNGNEYSLKELASPQGEAKLNEIAKKSPKVEKNKGVEVNKYKTNKTDGKYENALDKIKNNETVEMKIDGKIVKFQKNGDTYNLMTNQAGIKNARGDSNFTKAEVKDLLKTSENNIKTEIEIGELDVKYESALDVIKNNETIVIEIDGKVVKFQKNGDHYDLITNQAGIKNVRGDSNFTKTEVRDLLKESENSIKANINEIEITAKYEKVLSEKNNEMIELEIDGRIVRFQKKGDIYELLFNGAGIKNIRGDSNFTKAELIELAKKNPSNLSIEGIRIEEVELTTNTSKDLSSSPEGRVVKKKIQGLTTRIKEFFKKPTESGVPSIEQDIAKTDKDIVENKKISTKIKTEAKLLLQKIKDTFARWKQQWTREKTTIEENNKTEIAKTDINQVDMATSTNEALSSSPEGRVVKKKIQGLTTRIKEFFKKPTESGVPSIEQDIAKTDKDIVENKKISTKIKTEAKLLLQKIKDTFARRKQRWTREKTNTIVIEPKTMDELIVNVKTTKGIDAYKQGKPEADGTVSPSGDKEFIKSPEIVQALKDGNFETLNFQKGDPMLALRQKGVEFYIKEKITSIEDMIAFIETNKTLFGGKKQQDKFIEELKKVDKKGNIDNAKNLEGFNKKVQDKNSGISGAKSETGFDMKAMIDSKVKELTSNIKSIEEKAVVAKEEVRTETTPATKYERFNLSKTNPDTQKVIGKLRSAYPKLEPLFDRMVVKDYNSKIVQQHLSDLNMLPPELMLKIREENIVFFISNEGVTSWIWNAGLKGTTPRGWEESGWKRNDVAGMANEVGGVHAGKGEHGSVSLVLHELGHQIDVKGIVNITEVKTFYEKIKAEKKLDEYFLQEGNAGLQEFFAESFADFYKIPKAEFESKYSKEYREFLKDKIKEGEVVKESSKEISGMELPETYFEKFTTFDGLYTELDRMATIYSLDAKRIFTAKQLKTAIEKGETQYLPREGGFKSKVEELIKDNTKKGSFSKPKIAVG